MWMPSPAACATVPHSAPAISAKQRRSFFILRGSSVRAEYNAVGDRLELAGAAPPRHEKEKREVQQRAGLRDVREGRCRLLGTEKAEDEEHDDECEQKAQVPQ